MELDLCISVVLYHNSKKQIEHLSQACLGSSLAIKLVFIDNAPGYTDFDFNSLSDTIDYLPQSENQGYGRGHNRAILDPKYQAKYHLIANPDVRFTAKDLKLIYAQMESEPEISLLMPQIVWPDGSDQGLRKLLPRPSDLFVRRFLPGPLQNLYRARAEAYELKGLDSTKSMMVPVLSGCFMFCRGEILRAIGGFDPRFFLYLEDVDLSRRLGEKGKTIYWPEVQVIHEYQKSSYRSLRPLLLHSRSAWQYFNKHGWLRDPYREAQNEAALTQHQVTD